MQEDGSPRAAIPASAAPAAAAGPPILLQDPPAAYVVVASTDCIRLYSIQHVVLGDRTTIKKLPLAGQLLFAAAVSADGAPALVCLVAAAEGETHMQVFSLPGLELVSGLLEGRGMLHHIGHLHLLQRIWGACACAPPPPPHTHPITKVATPPLQHLPCGVAVSLPHQPCPASTPLIRCWTHRWTTSRAGALPGIGAAWSV